MRLLRATVSDFKRISLAELELDGKGHVVEIAGRNAQGKSSLIDAIATTLEGAATKVEDPIRHGAEKAEVKLVLGNHEPELVVTKRWGKGGTPRLIVERADGGILRKPQEVMDSLFAPIALDPGRFLRATPKDRRATLLRLMGVDLDRFDELERGHREKRTEVGRALKQLEGELAGVPVVDGDPEPLVSVTDLVSQIQQAQEANRRADQELSEQRQLAIRIDDLTAQIARLEAELEAARSRVRNYVEADRIEVGEIERRLRGAEKENEEIRRRNDARERRKHLSDKIARVRDEYEGLTEEIEQIDAQKSAALEAGLEKAPIPGLGVDGQDMTFDGVALSSCSQSEQIRIGMAMALAASPRLPVVLVRDASLFDAESKAEIVRQASQIPDALVILECVGDGGDGAWVIEDGAVARSPEGKEASAAVGGEGGDKT